MADYVELYFGSPENTDTTIATLGELLRVHFEPSVAWYADFEAHRWRRHYDLTIGVEEDQDDVCCDMPFTQMPFILILRHEYHRVSRVNAALKRYGQRLLHDLHERGYGPLRLIYATTQILAKAG
ncbi:hypothetical protein [Allokutzneria albata]|uniref:Uncharacterized protein n=1 Tax=Allokutzneria albata TaxID=211114 RepID=A0A1G9YAX4_ALLAB|nr:hypothetical protein [Allokutzneria albata]SDN06228.1 hypothetical protein SAMN04489726_4708 [Allokutzneria albata]